VLYRAPDALPGERRETRCAGYGASAEAILNGRYYRAVTALVLHADGVHLIEKTDAEHGTTGA